MQFRQGGEYSFINLWLMRCLSTGCDPYDTGNLHDVIHEYISELESSFIDDSPEQDEAYNFLNRFAIGLVPEIMQSYEEVVSFMHNTVAALSYPFERN